MRSTSVALLLLLTSSAGAADITDVEFARVGNTRLLLDARTPDGPGPYPAVVWVHGGGFMFGDKKAYPRGLADKIGRAGFAWFSLDYRLAPKHPFPAATDDIERGLHFIKEHAGEYKVDPNRLVLMGESAGGHLVSFVGAKHRPENRVAAVVPLYGEHDLVRRIHPEGGCFCDGKYVPNPHPGAPQFCLSRGLSAFLGITGPGPESEKIIREASPITYVRKDMPAYLFVHGTLDLAVPFDQSVFMYEAMKKAGARCDLYAVDGGGHGMGGWDKNPAQSAYQAYLIDWLNKNVK
jgi:alpha-L-fucosidase 2